MDSPSASSVTKQPLAAIETIVTTGWQWYIGFFYKLISISLIAFLPQIVIDIIASPYLQQSLTEPLGWQKFSLYSWLALLSIITGFWTLWGTLAIFYFIHHRDQKLTAWQAWKLSGVRFGTYLATNIVYGLIIMGGVVLLIIPGIYWYVLFMFAPMAAALEGKGVSESLARSKQLVKGYWFDTFWRNIVLLLIVYFPSVLINTLVGFTTAPVTNLDPNTSHLIDSVIGNVTTLLITPLGVLFSYALYRNITKIKD